LTIARLTVLVAEDHDDTRDFLAMTLEAQGYSVLTASNGKEALDVAVAHAPAAIIMDLAMPTMDGIESSLQIKEQPGLQAVPIVACTGYEVRHEWRPGLFAAILLKPVSPSQLLGVLEELLPRHADAGT
jgi:CheY-like chemotaxis protein